MIKENKNVSDGLSGNTQSNLPVVVKRDGFIYSLWFNSVS